MSDLLDLAHVGKHLEELGESVAILGRIICQGIAGVDPDTGKPNLLALQEEIADVFAMSHLTIRRFGLDKSEISARSFRKARMKQAWHDMLAGEVTGELRRITAERDGEREARQKIEEAYRRKDAAMGVLFERLAAAGVDCSDLIP